MISYEDIYEQLSCWIQDGSLPFEGERSEHISDDLDKFILKLFGITWRCNEDVSALIDALTAPRPRQVDIDWLFGEHGLTLLKAKIARDQ